MSKKFKSQASSARAASSTFGGQLFGTGSQSSAFQTLSSPLSYVTEPPDFGAISDSRIVVAFKNLTKKDSVTKTKALEDLQEILSADTETGPEPAVLDAWINIYPRTSVDNVRKVRQLAHSLQGSLTVQSGKRIAPQLRNVIGPWLAGTFDCDKSVSRMARESLQIAFPSEAKQKAIWEIYQGFLLDYVEDALLRHSPQTLSDERITSPDDAEAKYVRVISTALFLLDGVLQMNQGESPIGANNTFQVIITARKTYEVASHNDSNLRKALYKLIQHAIDQEIQLNWPLISVNVLAKALHINQTNSSGSFMDTLLAITRAHPNVWTTEYASKTSVSRRLHQFLRQGSQRGSENWWPRLLQLIESIPLQAWSDDPTLPQRQLSYDAGSQLLSSLHEGVASSDEPRRNQMISWPIYVDIFFWTIALLDETEEQNQLSHSFLYPIIERYLNASPHLSQWATPVSVSLGLCSSSIVKLEALYPLANPAEFYEGQVKTFVETMKQPEPESSKKFKQSQDDVIEKSCRFFGLQTGAEQQDGFEGEVDVDENSERKRFSLSLSFKRNNLYLLSEAIKLLRDRAGKPYGAAGVIFSALEKKPSIIHEISRSNTPDMLSELLGADAPGLLGSPSAHFLVSIMLQTRSEPAFPKYFDIILQRFLRDETLRKSQAYGTLLRGITNDDMTRHPELEQLVFQDLETALGGDNSRWPMIHDILSNQDLNQKMPRAEQTAASSIQGRLFHDMFAGLSLNDKEDNALQGLDLLLSRSPSFRQILPSHINLPSLLTRLLLLTDSPNERTAETATRLASLVKTLFARQDKNATSVSSSQIVHRQLEGQDEALPILSVVEIAREAIEEARKNRESVAESVVLPTPEQWRKALTPFLQLQPPSALSLISPLQGFGSLVCRERRRSSGGLPRDSEGFSMALRLAILVTKLLDIISLDEVNPEQRQSTYLFYPQALQLVDDKLKIESANALWVDSTAEVAQELSDIVGEGQQRIRKWLLDERKQDDTELQPTMISCWLSQLDCIDGLSAETFNLGRTFTSIMADASDIMGISKFMPTWNPSLSTVKSASVKSAALLVLCRDALGSSTAGKQLCNQLVADATEANFDDESDAIRRLVVLNLLIKGEDDLINGIPSQRLIFLAKHLLSIPSFPDVTTGLQSELLSTLTSILPSIKELYGEFWTAVVELLDQYLKDFDDVSQIVPLHSSLWLYSSLLSLTKGDCNEDLQEEMSKVKASMEGNLLNILTLFDETPAGANRPLETTTALLARQLQELKFGRAEEITELYPLLSSEYQNVQGAAYGVLHRSIPSIGEQVSIETVLSKTKANLPEELLSLLLDAPSIDSFGSTIYFTDSTWVNVRRYLLSWKVVFDHFSSVSQVVREAYSTDVKDHGHLEYLLNFACELLRITSGRPVDASKFDITDFRLDEETYLERQSHWLIAHLYYLSLLYLPSLSKSWWIEQKNSIKIPLETWSRKHICPLIVSACLNNVSDWHDSINPATRAPNAEDEDHPLRLKVNPRASELIASIPVDPESPPMALCVTLPPTYPFTPAIVTSVARVGIPEQKWQSWLRTIQGVMMFGNHGGSSSSSLIDGLQAFRHNVQAALKGQTECAICYSVIGTEMKVPDKKCATCQNMFHSACLYRWFRSSNSSSCPLCRNGFHYA